MTDIDPAFRVIPKRQTCFFIWRIEKMMVVPVPREQYGNFYTGDSYIILSVVGDGEPRGCDIKVKDVRGSLDMHIHFWLGSETSQDEAGVAAFKSVELDDQLGGAPVQHREVEGQESKIFLSYFKGRSGVKYLKGGVATGFTHVEHTFKERLLQVKGKHHVRIWEVPISWASINEGDVFILDLGKIIFVWNGSKSSRTERIQGAKAAQTFRGERGGCDIILVMDGEENTMTGDEQKLFNNYLPLNHKSVQSLEAGGRDEAAEKKAASIIKLYVCADENGMLKVTEKKAGPLYKADLLSKECFIIDNGEAGIWVWTGKGSPLNTRKEAMRNALGFINKKGYHSGTPITRVIEGGEPVEFKCLFKTWPEPVSSNKAYSRNRIAKTVQTKFDASTLHENQALAAETQMVDDGSGRVEIWRVEDFEMVPLHLNYFGQFYGGDCYLILYTYKVNNKENYIIYYWQGQKSTADEKGTSAFKAVELDDKYGGAPVQVRVVQDKEPAHFLSIFNGKMIIFSGGKAGWKSGEQDEGPGDRYMLQVRGTNKVNEKTCAKAVQVPMRAASLNSNDVFVVFGPQFLYIWCGKGSTGDEREMAKTIASRSNREPLMVFEGHEKNDFWDVLGGQEEYASNKRLQEDVNDQPARLFQCSNASGRFSVDEIPDFAQIDLVEDDVMLLDARESIFVWIGSGANKEEKDKAEDMAIEYLKTDPSERDIDTPIIRIKLGYEPPTFTGFFGAWDRDMWSKGKTYEELKAELGGSNMGMSLVQEAEHAVNGQGFSEVAKYPYPMLSNKTSEELPPGVDPSAKEVHLTDEDFEKVFKMKYSDFITKPVWKQTQLKKSVKMF